MIEQDLFDKMLITSHYNFAIMRESVNHPIPQKEKNMGIKVAINGYGRIGRQVLRAIYD